MYDFRDVETMFPSPHGDKFQQILPFARRLRLPFPSPHGDKFQQGRDGRYAQRNGFRPLTGINFNKYNSRHILFDVVVSVPSRG